jgi:acid phosphatase
MRSTLVTVLLAASGALAASTRGYAKVPGKAFDRFVVIWLENTDYDKAAGDPNLAWLAKKGITLSSYYAVTHPSQPNYCAAIGGDYFGMNHDDFTLFPKNISTIIDALEDKGVSWAEYMEDMPSVGYKPMEYLNQETGANDYVRKHNPAVNFGANYNKPRLHQMKPLTYFFQDLKANNLPQWMFITPNMTSDGHDSSVTVAGTWTRTFLEPLLDDANFMDNTLVLVTFDENDSYPKQNNVFAILLGDAVPKHLVGTTDHSYYNHYSEMATVEANWDLHHLGRFDAGANVFDFVAKQTGDEVRAWTHSPKFDKMYFNESYAGREYDEKKYANVPWPVPNPDLKINGRTTLPTVAKKWRNAEEKAYYKGTVEIYDGLHPPPGYGVGA